MSYLGDFRLGDTFDTKFTTTAAATGAPTTLAGTPVVSAYVGNSTTQITAGITLTVDFDTVTGLHNVRVVATSGNGFSTASNYQLVITTGTVGGTSAVGYVIGEFSIEARSAIMPTTAARTLDVSATGEAGVDWANVGGATTAVSLTNTTVATVTTTTTATNLTTNNDKTGYALSAAGVDAIHDEPIAAHLTADTMGLYTILGGGILLDTTITGVPTSTTYQLTAGSTVDNYYNDQLIYIITGTGAGQCRPITGYTGATKTITVGEAYATTPAAADRVIIQTAHIHPISQIQAGLALEATAQSILTDTTEIGVAGAGLTNINLPDQTMNITGNITGNLSGSVGSVTGAVGSVTGRVTANTDQINGIATAAARLAKSTQGIVMGTVGAASTTTSIVTSALDPAAAVIDQYKGKIITFEQGTTTVNLRGQSTDITANTALGVLTCTALTTSPVSGDVFVIT